MSEEFRFVSDFMDLFETKKNEISKLIWAKSFELVYLAEIATCAVRFSHYDNK